ncbi:MAG: hypothetical protein U5P10_00535 [Spirochaetia bacterium]|nr:hypothetical protein [Spirochaetia bacterium]
MDTTTKAQDSFGNDNIWDCKSTTTFDWEGDSYGLLFIKLDDGTVIEVVPFTTDDNTSNYWLSSEKC